jgi:hypothetical protein
MSDSLSLIVKTADNSRKASVTLPATLTIDQLLSKTQQQWGLDSNSNYFVRLERTGEQLEPSNTLAAAGLQSDDVLEVHPILEAG